MKALVYHGDHNIALEEKPKPKILKPTDVIVKVTKTTICGTDLGIYKGKNPEVENGRILGHEGIGIVEDVGASVRGFQKGDKVLISCVTSCGSCEYCKKQLYAHYKDGGWILGYMIDGVQAEYVRIPHADNSLYKIPDNIDDEIAVLLSDILPTGHEIGVQYGNVRPGDTIAIVGAGPVGLSVLLTAQFYSPSTIIMIDMDDNRLALAKELGGAVPHRFVGRRSHLPPILPGNPQVYYGLREAHSVLALALFAVILLHLAAALMHALVFKDGVFTSMAGRWKNQD